MGLVPSLIGQQPLRPAEQDCVPTPGLPPLSPAEAAAQRCRCASLIQGPAAGACGHVDRGALPRFEALGEERAEVSAEGEMQAAIAGIDRSP